MEISKIGVNQQQNIFTKNRTCKPKAVNFKSNGDENTASKESMQIEKPQRSLKAKKWGVGIASFSIPGVGQFVNGQVKKGFAMLGTAIGITILAGIARAKNISVAVGVIASLGLSIYSTMDAVRNVKPDKE